MVVLGVFDGQRMQLEFLGQLVEVGVGRVGYVDPHDRPFLGDAIGNGVGMDGVVGPVSVALRGEHDGERRWAHPVPRG